jgi:hypothetical protein
MRALESKLALSKVNKTLVNVTSKSLHKSFRATYYNLRLYYSNMKRNDLGMGKWDMVYGPDGFEKVKLISIIKLYIHINIIFTFNLFR